MIMKSTDDNLRRSKNLAYILRHDTESPFEPNGWLSVEYLTTQKGYTLDEIVEIVSISNRRFELSSDHRRVRALYGHSVPIDLQMDSVKPPSVLYHGTSVDAMERIMSEGLTSRSRTYVHLSSDEETAIKVGSRHGTAAVLTIAAERMYNDGYIFYHPGGRIWLVSEVLSQYLLFS
jgi:RNA:NAD 2''-phosphotransferase